MADDRSTEDPPDYRVYRSRPKLLGRRDGGGLAELDGLREGGDGTQAPAPRRRRLRPGRVLGFLALAVAAWLLVSLIVFLVSAGVQSGRVDDAAKDALTNSGFTLTSPNTVLVLGSDARTKGTAEPGSSPGGPSRADSIMLLRIGGGRNAQLSIPRDTVVDVPGRGRTKINAVYAIGGPALAIKTVEQYLGTPVNHVVEVNFENFPRLVDALGGVTYSGGCVVSRINGGARNGGYTLRLRAGKHEIDGEQALALARTRKNECAPNENDRTRARRQQKIMRAIKAKVISPDTFARLPWVSWAAPQAVRSDMAGPDLLGIVGATLMAGDSTARVLKPSGSVTLPDGGSGLTVSEAEKQAAVERFLRG
jgi:LCP family protein required for cell wall assembly